MKVSGFTFIKNGVQLGYPFIESIVSILPIVDEFVVNVGDSNDQTLERIQTLAKQEPKIRILQSQWNSEMRIKGFTYAQQKMIAQYNCTGDWAFYLEGDEVLPETDLAAVKHAMEYYLNDEDVEALVFDYVHFYGDPFTYAFSHRWYKRAPRIIRNSIRSFAPDGLYWLVFDKNNRKARYPKAALANGTLYHYGWVRPETCMNQKAEQVHSYWGDKKAALIHYEDIDPRTLHPFSGKHPAILESYLKTVCQTFKPNPNYSLTPKETRHHLISQIEKWLGIDLGKKHYRLVRKGRSVMKEHAT